jgi:ABC-2 type transport system ATP-binding protein
MSATRSSSIAGLLASRWRRSYTDHSGAIQVAASGAPTLGTFRRSALLTLGNVPEPAVEVTGLVKTYGETAAVAGLDLTAEREQVTAVLGPNGAGKTPTIETCEGYRRPDEGTVRVLGLDPQRAGPALKPRIGVMLQGGGGYPGARAGEMLHLFASYAAHPLDPDGLLDRLGLTGSARTPYRRLSGGERQRLGLAMAIVGRPELVFLDEPTAGLDPHARRATWTLIESLRADGVSIVLTTHYMEEAERLADQVVIVDDGRVVAEGTPAQLTDARARDELLFHAPPALDVDALATALPPGAQVFERAPGEYVVVAAVDPALLATVTAWGAERDVLVQDLRSGGRSLEDVFLSLTGKALR